MAIQAKLPTIKIQEREVDILPYQRDVILTIRSNTGDREYLNMGVRVAIARAIGETAPVVQIVCHRRDDGKLDPCLQMSVSDMIITHDIQADETMSPPEGHNDRTDDLEGMSWVGEYTQEEVPETEPTIETRAIESHIRRLFQEMITPIIAATTKRDESKESEVNSMIIEPETEMTCYVLTQDDDKSENEVQQYGTVAVVENEENTRGNLERMNDPNCMGITSAIYMMAASEDECGIANRGPVTAYRGASSPLSSHYPTIVKMWGITFMSVEKAYQFAKALISGEMEIAQKVSESSNATAAKELTEKVVPTGEFIISQMGLIYSIVEAHYDKCAVFRKALNEARPIIANANADQTFWGTGTGLSTTITQTSHNYSGTRNRDTT